MKKIAILLSFFIFLSACSSATEENVNSNLANSNLRNSSATNSNLTVPQSNGNSQMIPMNGVDPNAFNGNSSNIRTVNRDTSNIKPPLAPQSVPDESEFQSMGKPDGSFVETRTFKNHPQLVKIERITKGAEVSRKVYLKNGKSYNFTEEQIPNFRIAATQNILIAIGIEPQFPTAPATQKKVETQGENDTEKN